MYHCDTLGSNEFQEGTPDRHYQCALLQADGRRDLENDPTNRGDGADLYAAVAGTALSSTSNPHSREWDGRESGLVLSDVSEPGERMAFRVGQGSAPPQTARGEQSPDLEIPDNDPAGVSSGIDIAAPGVVRRIKVAVDITHTYVGDLLVELVSPTGRRAVLHARQGGPADDLNVSYDSDRPGELGTLVGQPMQGPWLLRVSDRAAVDVGRLRRWSLEIESASA